MSSHSDRGRFLWYDLVTTDPAAAIDFYSAITGWTTQEWQGEEGAEKYTMWVTGGKPIGGVVRLNESQTQSGVPTHWISHISTPDVDATAARITELGGKIWHGPFDIPTIGRDAIVADPLGAVFAIYTPVKMPPESTGAVPSGEFVWHELLTSNYVKAFDFYHELFGWEKTEAMDMGELGLYQMYGRAGQTLGGMFNAPHCAEPQAHPLWLYYVMVDDADDGARCVTEHGGVIINGPIDVPGGGRIVQCRDPQGGMFALHSAPKAM